LQQQQVAEGTAEVASIAKNAAAVVAGANYLELFDMH
jgi:hypothetical protein